MKVRVAKGADWAYFHRCYKNAHPEASNLHNPEWMKKLKAVEGQWIEVETDHLFNDQFNTAPIPGVSENGLRLMIEDIDALEGDVRQGVVKCNWCFGYDRNHDGACDKCGKTDYLEPMKPMVPVAPKPKETAT